MFLLGRSEMLTSFPTEVPVPQLDSEISVCRVRSCLCQICQQQVTLTVALQAPITRTIVAGTQRGLTLCLGPQTKA